MSDVQRPRTLYEPSTEHDACGVGFVADLNNITSHGVVEMGLAPAWMVLIINITAVLEV